MRRLLFEQAKELLKLYVNKLVPEGNLATMAVLCLNQPNYITNDYISF